MFVSQWTYCNAKYAGAGALISPRRGRLRLHVQFWLVLLYREGSLMNLPAVPFPAFRSSIILLTLSMVPFAFWYNSSSAISFPRLPCPSDISLTRFWNSLTVEFTRLYRVGS